jgi:hypothetical protein
MDESITLSTQQLKHLNQKTNILRDRKGLDAWERKINIYIKTYKMVKKIIKEIQVNEQICTNLNFRKMKKTADSLRAANYGLACLRRAKD